jgi:YVTN family beta-propeller protein
MFVTGENGFAVSVVDPQARQVTATIALGGADAGAVPPRPMGAVLSPDGRTLYVSNGRGKSVSVIDAAARRVLRTIPDVGVRPWGIAVSADGTKVYTANGPAGDVSVVDVATGAVDRRVQTGGSPWGLAAAPAR